MQQSFKDFILSSFPLVKQKTTQKEIEPKEERNRQREKEKTKDRQRDI